MVSAALTVPVSSVNIVCGDISTDLSHCQHSFLSAPSEVHARLIFPLFVVHYFL